jgi:hypothetical protein
VNYFTINRFHTGDGSKKCEGLISTGLYQHPYELRNIFHVVSEESIIGTVSEEPINGMVTEESIIDMVSEESFIGMVSGEWIIGVITEESISLRPAKIRLFLLFLFWMHTTSQFINYL